MYRNTLQLLSHFIYIWTFDKQYIIFYLIMNNELINVILKRDRKLLYWIHNNIVDFTDENDESGLSWDSTHKEALKFMQSISKKDRVQKYGFYSP